MKPEGSKPYFREFFLPAIASFVLLALWAWFSLPKAPDTSSDFPTHQFPSLKEINLFVSKKGLWKLRVLREKALREGVLMETEDPWVRAHIRENGQMIPAKLRLKGDWTDHLKGTKWSFRVDMSDSLAYGRLKSFNLQHPRSRNFLDEWLFHEVLHSQGILSPRYDFVKVKMNGMQLGVYAIEEHFTKNLVESQGRREGPLMKFYEEGMWEARVRVMQDTFFPYMQKPLFEAAHAEAFQYRKLMSNPVLAKMHTSAISLMEQYKNGTAEPSTVFDLKKVAVQYALTDVFGGHHSQVWHNRRFYFNPVLSRLEPVVYDAYAGMPGEYVEGPFAGHGMNGNTNLDIPGGGLQTFFFRDTNFVRDYYTALWHFSDPHWVDSVWNAYSGEAAKRVEFLQREFWMYRFNADVLRNYAQRAREGLMSFNPIYLRLDSTEISGGNYLYCMENRSPLALRVRGEILEAYDGKNAPAWMEFTANRRPQVKVLGQDEMFIPASVLLRAGK